jgi:MFS family permease
MVQIFKILKTLFTLLILDIFMFIAVCIVNLLPSIYDRIEAEYGLPSISPIMWLEAFFIIIAAVCAVWWGYELDRRNRRSVFILGLLVWITGLLICAYATSFPIFVIGRLVTGIGIGAQMPAMYSVVADIIPPKFWSTEYALLALLSALGNSTGNFISAFIAPMNIWGMSWKFPFMFFSLLSLVCLLFLLIIRLPQPGENDPVIGEAIKSGLNYSYKIRIEDLPELWRIPTNRYMVYLCFFAVIPGATLAAFLVYYMINNPFSSFPAAIKTQISAIFSGMVGVGYLLGTFFLGPVFDWLSLKNRTNRAKYTSRMLFFSIPLLITAFLFIQPVDYNSLNLDLSAYNTQSFDLNMWIYIVSRILEMYPNFVVYFFCLFFGTFLAAVITINRTPALLQINLPEHQASGQSMLNLSDQVGKAFAFIVVIFVNYSTFVMMHDRITLLPIILSVLSFIPAAYWWGKIAKVTEADFSEKERILTERKEKLLNQDPEAQIK